MPKTTRHASPSRAGSEPIVTHPHGATSGTPEPEAASEYEAFTVEELRNELRGRELATSGNKAELVERLEADDATTGD